MTTKTREEIESLKASWSEDPCWDIEDTEGFEEHRAELLAYREKRGAEWAAETKAEHEAAIEKLIAPGRALLRSAKAGDGGAMLRAVAEMLLPIVQRLDRLDERQEAELRKLEDHVDQQVRRLDGNYEVSLAQEKDGWRGR